MLIGYISTILLLFVVAYLIKRSSFLQFDNRSLNWSYFAFGLKVSAGLLIWAIYTFYYKERTNADIYKYFDDASYLFQQTEANLWLRWKLILGLQNHTSDYNFLHNTSFWFSQNELFFNDNRTLTRIHLILFHFSGGFYHFHTLTFAFLSFVGSFGLYRFFSYFSAVSTPLIFISSILFPSLLLWTSAPLKESYLLFALGMFLWSVTRLSQSFSKSSVLLFLLCLVNLLLLKVYFFFSLIPSLIFLFATRKTKSYKLLFFYFTIISIGLIGILGAFSNQLIPALASKQQQFVELLNTSNANSGISIGLFNNLSEFLISIPQALFNVYIRPVYPPNWNLFSIVTALEALVFIGIIPFALLFFRPPNIQSIRLFLFFFFFIFIAGTIIGSTTPILGAIVRYRAPLIPFYLMSLFIFVDTKKMRPLQYLIYTLNKLAFYPTSSLSQKFTSSLPEGNSKVNFHSCLEFEKNSSFCNGLKISHRLK